ncbi:MAG: putative competence-damage inducible protein [Promethearchaeota archaeon]|nr:MAG: putative competence-damage inducible protein [Candidatus Lokiarchaeota archaeon]
MEYLKKIEELIRKYSEKGKMIAFAESCTGGFLSHMFTNISGASEVFERGVVCYSNEAKRELLNVDAHTLEHYGAVSEQVAYQLCQGIRDISGTEAGVGVTGIAGPTGGTPEKPVGLVYIGFASEKRTFVSKHIFKSNRIRFKELVLEQVLLILEEYISST